jgi:hypothetical protein
VLARQEPINDSKVCTAADQHKMPIIDMIRRRLLAGTRLNFLFLKRILLEN